jgi:hypothetical protein
VQLAGNGELPHEVLGELRDRAASLDLECQPWRQGSLAVPRAEDVAADGTGRVAVPGMGDRQGQRVLELLGPRPGQRR